MRPKRQEANLREQWQKKPKEKANNKLHEGASRQQKANL